MTTSTVYGSLGSALFSSQVNYLNDDIAVMLLDSNYIPDTDNHGYIGDVSGSEISGPGYDSGGLVLSNKEMIYDAANNKLRLTCDNPSWASTTWNNVKYMVFYDMFSGALLSLVDFETPQSTTTAPFTYLIPADGFLNLTIV